jgi:hypothetical protein
MRSFLLVFIFVGVLFVSGCDDSFDLDKYKSYKDNGEMEDAVKEWVSEAVSDNCRVSEDRKSIDCY